MSQSSNYNSRSCVDAGSRVTRENSTSSALRVLHVLWLNAADGEFFESLIYRDFGDFTGGEKIHPQQSAASSPMILRTSVFK